MTAPGTRAKPRSPRPHRFGHRPLPFAALAALWLALLAGPGPVRLAAQEQPATQPPPASPASPEPAPPPAPPAAQQAPQPAEPPPSTATAPPPTAPATAAPAEPPPEAATTPPPAPPTTQPPAAPPGGENPAPPQEAKPSTPAAVDGVSAGMTAAKLLLVDVREVFRSPEHWNGEDWALFGLEVAAVAGVGAADESLQRDVRRSRSSFEDDLAKDFRTFGNYGSFEVLGGFYIAGLIAHDKKAQETTLDGLFASGIAGGLISPFLKLVFGRVRPNATQDAYDFHPFSVHNVSFPSGESTQAFAVAAVIATQYPNPAVEFLSYTTAAITSWGRVRENGHWVSDALAGALIGYHVGRRVVHINQRLRAHVSVSPAIGNGRGGLMLTAQF